MGAVLTLSLVFLLAETDLAIAVGDNVLFWEHTSIEIASQLFLAFREMRNVNFQLIRSRIQTSSRPATISIANQTHDVDYKLDANI